MRMTIGQKIMLFGILPSIATAFFIYVVISEKVVVKSEADRVNSLTQYIVSASGLVHELQKERGASAVYIGSDGKEMKDGLEECKRNTDRALASFQDFMKGFDAKQYGAEISSKITAALNYLNELPSKRSAVLALSLTKQESTAYYTSINTSFIQTFEQVALQANHPKISAPAFAYVNFISAKEMAGIERAVMSGIVAANAAIDKGSLNNWMTFWKGQERLLGNFEYLASKEVLSCYKSNLSGPVVEKVSAIRNIVFEKANEGNFGITGKETFEAATQRINILKNIENFQAEEIQNLSKRISTEAKNGIVLYAIISIVSVLAAVGLNMLNMRLATRITNLFRDLLSSLTESAAQVASASEQVSASSQSLSEATSEQAASVEETSATMEEIAAMTSRNADNAKEASNMVKACNDTVARGENIIAETDNAMKDISESSGKIANIIKIIEGIAFQTNLLALNAAVEAARAGEHGRGFAVVAEEVRALAQRSASAAHDITNLVTDSVKKAEKGTELVKNTKGVFSEIVGQEKKVTDLVNEIAVSSTEQSNGIDQISKAIQQMDQVIQQNAANSEETSAASEELSAHAQGLKELVNTIAREINMDGEGNRKVGKPAEKRMAEESEEYFMPHKKKSSPIKKEITGRAGRRTSDAGSRGAGANREEDVSGDGKIKKAGRLSGKYEEVIPMSNDDFKDF